MKKLHILSLLLIVLSNCSKAQKIQTYSSNNFLFKLYIDSSLKNGGYSYDCIITKIQIINRQSKKLIQTIKMPENLFHCGSTSTTIDIEDMNFDKLVDFKILQFPSASPNLSYYCWLYNNKQKKFIRNKELEEITSPDFNPKNKTIVSFWRASGAHHGISTYKYFNGKITLVEESETYRDDTNVNKCIATNKHLIKGKMVLVDSTVDVDMSYVPSESTLDSLQGYWVSVQDSLNKMIIKERTRIEWYNDMEQTTKKDTFSIFFSDTLIDYYNSVDYAQHRYDSSKTSGEFIILISQNKEEYLCLKLERFWLNENKKFVSIIDTWQKKRPTIYYKTE